MSAQPATTTYTIPESFEKTVIGLRNALSRRNLRVMEMLNLSEHIQRRLSIRTPPCVVLLVAPAASGFDALRCSSVAYLFMPLHVVISDCGPLSKVHVLRSSQLDREGIDSATFSVLDRLQSEVADAIHSSIKLMVEADNGALP